MSNPYFQFKQFTIRQDRCAMKVGTDGALLGAWTDVSGVKRILDIGTGTGLIALMLAQRSDAMIDAIEPEPDSHQQAGENILNSPWHKRIRLFNIRLQEFHSVPFPGKSNEGKYDCIVTNPPYFIDSKINPDAKRTMSRHAVHFTREELMDGIQRLLDKSGRFSIILPVTEAGLFQDKAAAGNLFCTRKLHVKPLPDKGVKRVLMQFEWTEKPVEERTIVLETTGRHAYSYEYRELTRAFYLGF
jgi:tRNA1Val (adenine37-N6)-methyltransferase